MTIKPDAWNAFFSQKPDQSELAAALDEGFDINYGNYQFGQAFWLCDAKPSVKERFGLQREIIALYSPHSKPDARLLTALENISRAPEFRHRVDKVVALIIHNGNKDFIETLANQNSDWIIVPIHAADLRDKNRGSFLIRSIMAKRIGQFDLFGMSSPIKHDKYFYGREHIVQELSQRAIVKKENSGLFGLRKSGKTSVLFSIQRRLREKNVVCEYVDCQNPGIYGGRWWTTLEEICERILSGAKSLNYNDDEVLPFTPTSAANSFVRFIKKIKDSEFCDQLVLLLDEIEFITPGISNHLGQHWDSDHLPFWQTIRAASQETGGFLTFCVAGVNPSSVEQSHFGQIQNPIFQLAVPFYLEPMPQQSVRDMVRSIGKYSGIEFAEDTFEFLRNTYGGHPYLIRLACSEVCRVSGPIPVDKKLSLEITNFEHKQSEISARLSRPIKDIMLSLVWWYPDEYDLLCILSTGDEKFVEEFLEMEPEKVTHFTKYGLIHKDSGSMAIRDLKSFLISFGTEYRNAISPFKRGDMPPELLPEQPNLADLAKLFESRTEVEFALRKLIITVLSYKNAFDEKNITKDIIAGLTKQNHTDPSQLFIGRSPQEAINELYLSDLKSIFKKHWDTFGIYFDKNASRFEMNLDTINIARRYEAHTKPIPWMDRENFLNSYQWLKQRLSKVPGIFEPTLMI